MKKKIIALCILLIAISSYPLFIKKETIPINIDKIYILNLERSKNRYEAMTAQLDKLDLPVKYERFSAIDGNSIELVNRSTGEIIKGSEFSTNTKLIKGDFDIRCEKDWSGDFESLNLNLTKFTHRAKGEIGAACSHRKIWKDIVTRGYKNAMILEDDVILSPNFDQYIKKAFQHVPYDYDYIYLGIIDSITSYNKFSNPKFINKVLQSLVMYPNQYFRQVYRNVAGAWGYVVSYKGANILLNKTTKHRFIDVVISKLIKFKHLKAYVVMPLQITDAEANSTIGASESYKSIDNN